jgi:uncharacterized damage-inducible protein DinB
LYVFFSNLSRKEHPMTGKEAIKSALTSTQDMLAWYISDLSDTDLIQRPAPGANHIAWQLGHLIGAESYLIRQGVSDAAYPELPAGFVERHAKETAAVDPPTGYATKAQYLDLYNKARAATLAALDRLTDADLDKPTQGNMAKFAPRVGDLFLLVANHTMMHAGQFTVLRRKLGKPVLF